MFIYPFFSIFAGVNIEGVFNPNFESAKKFAKKFELSFYSNNLEIEGWFRPYVDLINK